MTSLYIISAGKRGPVKDGISDDPTWRLATLQSGNAKKLSIAWERSFRSRDEAYAAEREVHLFLSDFRKNGEWFALSPRDAIPMTEGCL